MQQDYDVIVVGLGPGGEALASELAGAGLNVVAIERRLVGGVCPYWGCIPTKMMVRAADALAEARRVPQLAGQAAVAAQWAPVAARIRDEATDNWDDTVAIDRLRNKGVTVIRGNATVTGPGSVSVGDQTLHATRAIVLNSGTEPAIPPIAGLDQTPYWTNKHAVETETVPESLAVIGGGAIGLEFAQVFARFGSHVTVIEAADHLLPSEEPEAGQLLSDVFTSEQIHVRVGATVDRVDFADDAFTVQLSDSPPVVAQKVLVATGRSADLTALGVAAAGIDASQPTIATDENLRAVDGIWAIGDVTGNGAFTHVSLYQARIAAADILARDHPPADYGAVPRVTFTDPEIGAVGLTEAAAREQGIAVRCATSDLAKSSRGFVHFVDNRGFIKLVADIHRGVLVGATAAGPMGGEILGALAVAVHAEVPLETLATQIYAYPTFHRAIEEAVRQLTT